MSDVTIPEAVFIRTVGMLVATFHSITAPAQLLAVFVWPYVFLSTSDKTHLSNPMR